MRDEIDRQEFDVLVENHRQILIRLEQLHAQMTDVQQEIGGAPRTDYRDPGRRSVRARLHDIETRIAADSLATEALKTARQRSWSRTHLWALLIIAGIGALGTILRLLGIGG